MVQIESYKTLLYVWNGYTEFAVLLIDQVDVETCLIRSYVDEWYSKEVIIQT